MNGWGDWAMGAGLALLVGVIASTLLAMPILAWLAVAALAGVCD